MLATRSTLLASAVVLFAAGLAGAARAGAAQADAQAPLAAPEGEVQQGTPGGTEPQAVAIGHAGCGCGDSCCSSCCGGACCRPCDQWYAGGGVYLFEPRWKTNPAFATSANAAGVTVASQTDFDYDFEFAPLVWAGYRSACGGGVQGRAWWYDNDDHLELVNPGATSVESAGPLGVSNLSTTAGDVLTYDSSLEIEVVDLLITYSGQIGRGSFELGVGGRYARIEQGYHHAEVPATLLTDAVSSTHCFEGAGPTVALQTRLGVIECLNLLAAFRYSLLIGEFEQQAVLMTDNAITGDRQYHNDDFRPVAELELGGEFAQGCGCCQLFVQAALVVQHWQGAGNSANNDLVIVNVDPEFSDQNADLLLWGFQAAAGLRF